MAELKPGWQRVKFGELVHHIAERAEPQPADNKTYVGLEHLETGSLLVRRWGSTTTLVGTKLRMRKGDILFARRNAYLRRVALAPHDGLFSAHGMVLRPKAPFIVPEFLPFFMQSDAFMDRAESISVGSLSPTINWTALREEEFALPPMEDQRQISRKAKASFAMASALEDACVAAEAAYRSLSFSLMQPKEGWQLIPLGELTERDAPICYGIVKLGEGQPKDVPVLRTQNLNGDYDDLYYASTKVDADFKRSRVQGGDILVAIQGASMGKIGLVPNGFHGNINRHVARIRPGERLDRSFFLHLWKSPTFSRYATSNAVGSTKPELTIGTLRALMIPVPPLGAQHSIAETLSATEGLCRNLSLRAAVARSLLRIDFS